MKLGNDSSGAESTCVMPQTSRTHDMLEDVAYQELFGKEPIAMVVFASFQMSSISMKAGRF